MELSVAQAADRLGVDRSRVHQLLRAGTLAGRRLGRDWLVDAAGVARLVEQRHGAGRPMAPARAWGLLDLLDGGTAPWLSLAARSQVRAQIRNLADADAGRWRDALRARSEVLPVSAHPAAPARILATSAGRVLRAGAERAVAAGADLVAVQPVPELYVRADAWPELAAVWHLRVADAEPNLRVRIPRGVDWPFADRSEVGPAALAADLLESAESRAVVAGAVQLRKLAEAR